MNEKLILNAIEANNTYQYKRIGGYGERAFVYRKDDGGARTYSNPRV